MGRIKITKAQMARLVELKTTNLLEIAVKKTQLDKVGPVRGGNSDNAIWPTTKDSGDPSKGVHQPKDELLIQTF